MNHNYCEFGGTQSQAIDGKESNPVLIAHGTNHLPAKHCPKTSKVQLLRHTTKALPTRLQSFARVTGTLEGAHPPTCDRLGAIGQETPVCLGLGVPLVSTIAKKTHHPQTTGS
jgi:hypothetical protein